MMRWRVSRSFSRASSGIRLTLAFRSSPTSSWKDFPENVGLPDLGGVPLKFLEQIVDHLLALLLRTHDEGQPSVSISARIIWMEGALAFQPHAIASPPWRTISGSSSTRESIEGTTIP